MLELSPIRSRCDQRRETEGIVSHLAGEDRRTNFAGSSEPWAELLRDRTPLATNYCLPGVMGIANAEMGLGH